MKKAILIITLLISVGLLIGCGGKEPIEQIPDDKTNLNDDKKETQPENGGSKVTGLVSSDANDLEEQLEENDIEEDIGSMEDIQIDPSDFLI